MPKTTYALHGDQISTAQAGVAKSVVRRDTCTEERGSFCGRELIRNGSDAAGFSDHHFGISPILGYSRYYRVLTIHHISASARFAHSIFAGDQADTDPLADSPFRHSAAQGFNAANYFMSRNARESQTRVDAGDRRRIGVTDSTCFYPDPNLTGSRFSHSPFHDSKHVGCGDFHRFVCVSHL
jgi:hypothetical protein